MGRVMLVSIAPVEIRVFRTYDAGVFFEPCSNGRKYSVSYCNDRTEYKRVHTDARHWDDVPIQVTGEQVANDLLTNEWLDREGVFICKTEKPTDADLAKAHGVRNEWLNKYVQHGDEEYSRNKNIREIPDFCKRAARELGVKREWVFAPETPIEVVQCEGCGSDVRPGVVICKHCGAIQPGMREKAIRLGITVAPKLELVTAGPSEEKKAK